MKKFNKEQIKIMNSSLKQGAIKNIRHPFKIFTTTNSSSSNTREKPFVVLNKTQMKNKELVKQFKSGGYDVIEDKKVPRGTKPSQQDKSFFNMTDKEKKDIIDKSAREANEMQRKLGQDKQECCCFCHCKMCKTKSLHYTQECIHCHPPSSVEEKPKKGWHHLYCFMCGRNFSDMVHYGGKKKLKKCEWCESSNYVCFKCSSIS